MIAEVVSQRADVFRTCISDADFFRRHNTWRPKPDAKLALGANGDLVYARGTDQYLTRIQGRVT